jgi:hypothetical protein
MTDGRASATVQRVVAVVVLLVGGGMSLPLSAAFLDGQDTENLVLPAQLLGMALLGAAVGALLPGLAGPEATRGRGAKVGAVVGLVMAFVGVAVFWLLLNGISGA